ncbi:MAG: alpha/beta hydrolase family protein [Saprospiraceae bacterium]
MFSIKKYFFFLCFALLVACSNNNVAPTEEEETTESTPMTNENFTELNVPWSVIAGFPKAPFTESFQYGPEELQFGELRMPTTTAPTTGFPVAVFIHGGCWLNQFDLNHVSQVSADLQSRGYAVWTPEYRRVGDDDGSFPNTFLDAAAAVDHLREIAQGFPLDLNNVNVLGHSAGGHLALWVAARQNIPSDSPIYTSNPLPIKKVIALAPITDLAAYDAVRNSCSQAVQPLMGGTAADQPERYQNGSPINLTPLNIPTFLVHGTLDGIVPIQQSEDYRDQAQADGDVAEVIAVEGAGHFDMVSPNSVAWGQVVAALRR